MGDESLAHADGAHDEHVVVGLEEAQGGELGQERTVEGDLGCLIPALKQAMRLEMTALGAESGGLAVAAGDFVLEGEQKQVLEGHLLLASEGESFGEGVEDG
jgi:hypothetical protein